MSEEKKIETLETPFVPSCTKCTKQVHYIDPEMFDLPFCQCYAQHVNEVLICPDCTVQIEGKWPNEKRYCQMCDPSN